MQILFDFLSVLALWFDLSIQLQDTALGLQLTFRQGPDGFTLSQTFLMAAPFILPAFIQADRRVRR